MTKTKTKTNNKRTPKQTPKMNPMKGMKSGAPRVRGRGGYAADIGSGLGSWLGKKAGDLFSKITGLGEYSVSSNTLTKPNNPPILSNTPAATRISHREFLGDISGSQGWALQSYPINPGMSGTFPWLSGPAGSFEQYRLHGLIFEFKSTSAVALNSVDTALGTVIMATEYNSTRADFTNKRDMENHMYSTSSPPSVSAMHPVECARDVTVLDNLYIRNAPVFTNTDLRFSDLGKFQLATIGMQNSNIIGELWCTYDVELLKPAIPDAYTTIAPSHYHYDVAIPAITAPTYLDLFGTPAIPRYVVRGTNVSNVSLNANTVNFITPGRYFITLITLGSSGTSQTLPSFSSTSAEVLFQNVFTNTAGTPTDTVSILGSYSSMAVTCVDVTSIGQLAPFVEISGLANGADLYQVVELFVQPVPSGFTMPAPNHIPSESEVLLQIRDEIRRDRQAISEQLSHVRRFIGDDEFEEHKYVEADMPQNSPVLRRSSPSYTSINVTRSLADLLTARLGSTGTPSTKNLGPPAA